MKTISLMIPEDLDALAAAEAERRGITKSQLIRDGIHAAVSSGERAENHTDDPWMELAGFGTAGVGTTPGEVDDMLYSS